MKRPPKNKRRGNHIPVLRALNVAIGPIKSILEFGCGIYSTCTFLDRKYFPDLESLNIYEHNKKWADVVKNRHSDPNRYQIQFFDPGEVGKGILLVGQNLIAQNYEADMMFVDCFDECRKYIMEQFCSLAKVVILHNHDSFQKRIRIPNFKYRFIYMPPYKKGSTGVFSNYVQVSKLEKYIIWENDYEDWTA